MRRSPSNFLGKIKNILVLYNWTWSPITSFRHSVILLIIIRSLLTPFLTYFRVPWSFGSHSSRVIAVLLLPFSTFLNSSHTRAPPFPLLYPILSPSPRPTCWPSHAENDLLVDFDSERCPRRRSYCSPAGGGRGRLRTVKGRPGKVGLPLLLNQNYFTAASVKF